MRSCAGLAVICLGLVAEVAAAEPVVHIRANQVGYLPGDSKMAVAFSNTPVTGTFALVEDGAAHVALTGDLAAAPASGWDGFAYYYRARFYAAQLGRFASRDPIGYTAGINILEHVGDSPAVLQIFSGREGLKNLQDWGYQNWKVEGF